MGEGWLCSTGADQRLNIFSPSLALVHTFHPAHVRLISSVACSTLPHVLATSSREGVVSVWDTRQAEPAMNVKTNDTRPPSYITFLEWGAGDCDWEQHGGPGGVGYKREREEESI